MTEEQTQYKVKEAAKGGGGFAKYRALYYGDASIGRVVLCELLITLFGWIPGALGLVLRSKLYPLMFPGIGKKVVFGRDVTIRHPHKIKIGNNAVIDDNCVIDAKGDGNDGITIGGNVYIGRNTIVYCKGGDIVLEDGVNISSNCQIFSSNNLLIKQGTMIGAYSYFLSGGEYDYEDSTPFAEQSGMCTRGPLVIGVNCWFGARVTVLDAACVGDHCVIAAGAVVNKPVAADSIAVGVPAKIIKSISASANNTEG